MLILLTVFGLMIMTGVVVAMRILGIVIVVGFPGMRFAFFLCRIVIMTVVITRPGREGKGGQQRDRQWRADLAE